MPHHLLCFGLGYCATALADALLDEGWAVTATSRDPEKAPALRARGLTLLPFDGSAPLERGALKGITHVLVSIPPGPEGDRVLAHHRADLAAADTLQWVGYLSTTGVYGDTQGEWVDETSPMRPGTERGARRVRDEDAWMSLFEDEGLPIHLFRLGGIYGPDRSPLDRILAGRAQRILSPGQVFNRSHRADILQALRASMDAPRPGAAYNVVDDEPAPNHEVLAYGYALLGLPVPEAIPLAEAALSPMGRSFYAENRRVSNALLKEELGVTLLFPTYREGLRGLL